MRAITTGLWSGIVANGPMTLALMRLFRTSRSSFAPSLPPAALNSDLMPIEPDSNEARANLSLVSHFLFSISAATVYSLLQKKVKLPAVAKGAIFGSALWNACYWGWIPLFGSRASGPNLPRSANFKMLLAHLVWGVSLGLAAQEFSDRGDKQWDGNASLKPAMDNAQISKKTKSIKEPERLENMTDRLIKDLEGKSLQFDLALTTLAVLLGVFRLTRTRGHRKYSYETKFDRIDQASWESFPASDAPAWR